MNVKWLQTLALSGLFGVASEVLKGIGGGSAPRGFAAWLEHGLTARLIQIRRCGAFR